MKHNTIPNTFEWVLPGSSARIIKAKTQRRKKKTISETFNIKKQENPINKIDGNGTNNIPLNDVTDDYIYPESPINIAEEDLIEDSNTPSIYQRALDILRAKDNFATEAEKDWAERRRYYVIPEGGEKARDLIHSNEDLSYILPRVEEAETMAERKVLLRMNPNAARNVTWRQDLTIDLPRGQVADLFINRRIESSEPFSDSLVKKKMKVEGDWTEDQQVKIRTITWKSTETTTLPKLLTPHWYLKKWTSSEGFILRAQCTELTFVWKEELDELRLEFSYYTELFNSELQSWQIC